MPQLSNNIQGAHYGKCYNKVTQQNAANAEESASASEELSAQAEQMNQIVQELVKLVGGTAATQHNDYSYCCT